MHTDTSRAGRDAELAGDLVVSGPFEDTELDSAALAVRQRGQGAGQVLVEPGDPFVPRRGERVDRVEADPPPSLARDRARADRGRQDVPGDPEQPGCRADPK